MSLKWLPKLYMIWPLIALPPWPYFQLLSPWFKELQLHLPPCCSWKMPLSGKFFPHAHMAHSLSSLKSFLKWYLQGGLPCCPLKIIICISRVEESLSCIHIRGSISVLDNVFILSRCQLSHYKFRGLGNMFHRALWAIKFEKFCETSLAPVN